MNERQDKAWSAPARLPPAVADASSHPEFVVSNLRGVRSVEARPRKSVPLLPFAGESGQAAEQYRIIRTKVLQHPSRPRSIVVSSAESGDGKSVTAVNIAGVLALSPESNVLLSDGDLHRTSLARYFDLPATPGLANIVDGQVSLDEALVRIEPFPNLYFLPGGKSQRGPADTLNSQRWTALAGALKSQFDYCVFDAPPAGALADFDLIQAVVDGVVLVVRQDHTNRLLWMRALESVPEDKLVGVVMNCIKPWFLGRGLGYYQYYYYSKYYNRS